MSSGLVYLRPSRAHFVRQGAETDGDDIASWNRLMELIGAAALDEGAVVRLFALRWPSGPYVSDERAGRFDVGAEFREDVATEQFDDLRILQVPGGTFVRHRFCGTYAEIPAAIEALRRDSPSLTSFANDDTRPVVEIHLAWSSAPFDTSRSEILLPIMPTSS